MKSIITVAEMIFHSRYGFYFELYNVSFTYTLCVTTVRWSSLVYASNFIAYFFAYWRASTLYLSHVIINGYNVCINPLTLLDVLIFFVGFPHIFFFWLFVVCVFYMLFFFFSLMIFSIVYFIFVSSMYCYALVLYYFLSFCILFSIGFLF